VSGTFEIFGPINTAAIRAFNGIAKVFPYAAKVTLKGFKMLSPEPGSRFLHFRAAVSRFGINNISVPWAYH
jgi:hypothetical protein